MCEWKRALATLHPSRGVRQQWVQEPDHVRRRTVVGVQRDGDGVARPASSRASAASARAPVKGIGAADRLGGSHSLE
jgi:hypothetical protein